MKVKYILLNIKSFLNHNKVWFETFAATLLGLMAIIISVLQFNISKKENILLEKQTKLSEVQTQLTKEQLVRSRITDSMQFVISQKQQNLLEVQTNFLYVPNLKVEFSRVFDSNKKIILTNDGKIGISDIRIRTHLGYYQYYNTSFKIKVFSLKDWQHINLIKPDKIVELPLDTGRFRIDLQNLEVEKRLASKGKLLEPAFNSLIEIIECFIIKYKSGPDLKEHIIRKYLEVHEDSKNKKLMLNDLDENIFDRKRFDVIKSLKIE